MDLTHKHNNDFLVGYRFNKQSYKKETKAI